MKEPKYILINCDFALYHIAREFCSFLKKNGDYFSVNITFNQNQFDVKSVTKEEFYKEIS
jgi:hypothetical protein